MAMDDAPGHNLRSNESLTKYTEVCCFTRDMGRPKNIEEVKVMVLLPT